MSASVRLASATPSPFSLVPFVAGTQCRFAGRILIGNFLGGP